MMMNNQLRGHNLKLNRPCANKSNKLLSFALRNIQVWNKLTVGSRKFKGGRGIQDTIR